MRKALDRLYLGSGYVAAVFLVAIAATVIAQIAGRFFGVAIDSTESAGFSMAASSFFGLAYTFKQGGHIRVNLLIRLLPARARRLAELWSIGACAAAFGYFTWWAFDLVYFSWAFNDISPGLLAIPFWIPRGAMALGALVMTVALVDELVLVARGNLPNYEANAETVFPVGDDEAPAGARSGGGVA